MDPKLLAVAAFAALVFVIVLYLGGAVSRSSRSAAARLAPYGREPTDPREATLQRPLSERALAPLVIGLGRRLRRFTPAGWLGRTQRRLVLAGNPAGLDASSWAVVKILSAAVALVVWTVVQAGMPIGQKVLAFVLFAILGFFGPEAWLNRRIELRRESMRRDLPDVLDLLVISMEAGLSFEAAMTRVAENVPGYLAAEFFRMLQETRVGVSRREAMRHVVDRTDLDELRSVMLALVQAEAFGVGIARVLRVQAGDMRAKRRQRAQEKAFAAPVKMVFPLALCVMPALFVVLLGPAAISVYETFRGGITP